MLIKILSFIAVVLLKRSPNSRIILFVDCQNMLQLLIGDSHSVRFHNFVKTQSYKDVDTFAAKVGPTVEEGRQLIKFIQLNDNQTSTFFLSLGSKYISKEIYSPNVTHRQFKSLLHLVKQCLNPEHLFIFKIPLFPTSKNWIHLSNRQKG